jgi:hypothetical protein
MFGHAAQSDPSGTECIFALISRVVSKLGREAIVVQARNACLIGESR